jgi:hypothetical protein
MDTDGITFLMNPHWDCTVYTFTCVLIGFAQRRISPNMNSGPTY